MCISEFLQKQNYTLRKYRETPGKTVHGKKIWAKDNILPTTTSQIDMKLIGVHDLERMILDYSGSPLISTVRIIRIIKALHDLSSN